MCWLLGKKIKTYLPTIITIIIVILLQEFCGWLKKFLQFLCSISQLSVASLLSISGEQEKLYYKNASSMETSQSDDKVITIAFCVL